jgi:hypothetical protein
MHTIRKLALAAAMVGGTTGLAMAAPAVTIDAVQEAPDSVYNPSAVNVYGVPDQSLGASAFNQPASFARQPAGYRAGLMLGGLNAPIATSAEERWFNHATDNGEM